MNKTTNQKYTIIVATFILTLILSLFIPIAYIQLFATPVNLLIAYLLLRNEITYDPETLNKEVYRTASQAFFICIMLQALLNFIGIQIFTQIQLVTVVKLIPIVPVYTVLAAILEEMVFRKIIFGWLQRSKEKFSILAATISSALFAIAHLNFTYLMGYFVVGFVLCYYYHKTKQLKIVILAHILINFFALFSQSIHIVFGG